MRQLVICVVLVVAVAVPLSAPAKTGKPAQTCPAGFTEPGSVSLAEFLALPRTVAAIADGLTTESDVEAAFGAIDVNGTGSICVQLTMGLEKTKRPFGQYLYDAVDDNASVPH